MKTKTKKKKVPYINLIMLGLSVGDFVGQILDEDKHGNWNLNTNDLDQDWLEKFIRMLVASKDTNIKFVHSADSEDSIIYAPKLDDLDALTYDQDNWWGSEEDSIAINQFILDFYGTTNKEYEPKITQEQYTKKKRKCCPACGSKDLREDEGWMQGEIKAGGGDKVECVLGCNDCNAQWNEVYKLVGFKDLRSR